MKLINKFKRINKEKNKELLEIKYLFYDKFEYNLS